MDSIIIPPAITATMISIIAWGSIAARLGIPASKSHALLLCRVNVCHSPQYDPYDHDVDRRRVGGTADHRYKMGGAGSGRRCLVRYVPVLHWDCLPGGSDGKSYLRLE
jgi:hypothetical protein